MASAIFRRPLPVGFVGGAKEFEGIEIIEATQTRLFAVQHRALQPPMSPTDLEASRRRQ